MNKCAEAALDIQTYYAAQNQATHPNVISFSTPWNGYRYYMAYTPYPYGNGFEENPCLAVSNDLLHWEIPDGMLNPIACAEETACDELKHTHLVYREDLNRLEMWYLGRIHSSIRDGGPLYCFRKFSYDAIHWSSYEVMYKFESLSLASPSIVWENNRYRFWGIYYSDKHIGLYYMESDNGLSWSKLKECSVPEAYETQLWHGTVIPTKEGYSFVWVGKNGINADRIYYSKSTDGFVFDEPSIIVENDTKWKSLYRPALLIDEGKYYLFYGVIRCDGKWLIGLSSGPELSKLKGVSSDEVGWSQDRISSTPKMRLQEKQKYVTGLVVPSLVILETVALMGVHLFEYHIFVIWGIGILLGMIMNYIKFNKNHFLFAGFLNGTVSAAAWFLCSLGNSLLEGIGALLH